MDIAFWIFVIATTAIIAITGYRGKMSPLIEGETNLWKQKRYRLYAVASAANVIMSLIVGSIFHYWLGALATFSSCTLAIMLGVYMGSHDENEKNDEDDNT